LVFAIGEGKSIAEGAVVTKFDEPAADAHLGVGLGGAVDDELGVDVEPEPARLFRAAVSARDAAQLMPKAAG
jgi:hypothetical protein